MKYLYPIYSIFSYCAITVLAILGIVTVINKITLNFPLKILSVVSGSMEPTIPVGSAVIVINQPKYQDNDIITYKLGKILVTHRIVYNKQYILTKGDANKDIDPETVSQAQIVGKVVIGIPYLGYLQERSKTIGGLFGYVIVPALFIVLHECLYIIHYIKKQKKSKTNVHSVAKELCLITIFVVSDKTGAFYAVHDTFPVKIQSIDCDPIVVVSQQGSSSTLTINSSGGNTVVTQNNVEFQSQQIIVNSVF